MLTILAQVPIAPAPGESVGSWALYALVTILVAAVGALWTESRADRKSRDARDTAAQTAIEALHKQRIAATYADAESRTELAVALRDLAADVRGRGYGREGGNGQAGPVRLEAPR